jgi:hypothetical protein
MAPTFFEVRFVELAAEGGVDLEAGGEGEGGGREFKGPDL